MHERERHNVILAAVQERPVVTVQELIDLTDSSAATIRRDIAALHVQKKLRRVRGGAEAIAPPRLQTLAGKPFTSRLRLNIECKRAIAERAVQMCVDGDPIIINGGTTTYQMVHHLRNRRLQIFTNSFPIAEVLLKQSANMVVLAGGTVYPELNVIISPFEEDGARNFYARRMFMGAQGISRLGLMETDPLLVQAERKLIHQADELVVLVDSTKFASRSSLILCPLERVSTIVTDSGIDEATREMIADAGIELIVVDVGAHGVDRRTDAA